MSANADEALLALVHRYGRKGINEAAVWTMLRADVPGLTIADSAALIERLIAGGRLYRDRRRTRTMLHISQPQPVQVVAEAAEATLFDRSQT